MSMEHSTQRGGQASYRDWKMKNAPETFIILVKNTSVNELQ